MTMTMEDNSEIRVESDRRVIVRTRYGDHTNGTKCYRVTLITYANGRSNETYLVKSWGKIGNANQCAIERHSHVGAYETAIINKQKVKAGGYYCFSTEEKFEIRVDSIEDPITAEIKLSRALDLTGIPKFATHRSSIVNFLQPRSGEKIKVAGPVAVDQSILEKITREGAAEGKTDEQHYGSEWGEFS